MAWLTTAEAAKHKGCSLATIRKLLQDDERRKRYLPSARYEGEGTRGIWYILQSELDAWTQGERFFRNRGLSKK